MTDTLANKTGRADGAASAAATAATTFERIATFSGRMAKVTGPVRSGKTEALVQRACTLVCEGADPANILMVASTAEAVRILRARLAAALESAGVADARDAAARCTIATARDVCLSVLDTPEARAATGRVPRVLLPFEYNFFLEDMKTLGQPIRRLRSVLQHFKRQWCLLEAEDEWVVPGDEQDALELAHRLLDLESAMLEDEVAYVCGRFLQSEAGAASTGAFTWALIDDFQNLSRAQQICLCLLARDQIIVAGNVNETLACATAFPDPQGFATFDTLRRGVETFQLDTAFGNPNITGFCDALCRAESMDASVAAHERIGETFDIATVKWNTPEEEFNGLTRYLFALTRENPDTPESRIAVVVPNRAWARAFNQMLAKRGYEVSELGFERIGGDPRDMKRARVMMAYTTLNLLADPTDVAAWRAWLGFGNYLTLSEGILALTKYLDEQGCTFFEALDAASAAAAAGEPEPFLRAGALAARYDEGRSLIEKHSKRRGYNLLAAIGADRLPEFAPVQDLLIGDEDVATLFEIVRTWQLSPVHKDNAHAIHVNSYEQMCGCDYDTVYAVGCVDGLMPARNAFEVVSTDEDRARVMNADRRRFMAAVGKASRHVMFSSFSKADLELAERTKMQVMRVRMEDGERVATLRPTSFIAEAGACAPLTLGGQALLSDMGID